MLLIPVKPPCVPAQTMTNCPTSAVQPLRQDVISPDKTPSPVPQLESKTPGQVDAPSLPSPDPVLVHCQSLPTPEEQPGMVPPPVGSAAQSPNMAAVSGHTAQGAGDRGTVAAPEWPPPPRQLLESDRRSMDSIDFPDLPPPPPVYTDDPQPQAAVQSAAVGPGPGGFPAGPEPLGLILEEPGARIARQQPPRFPMTLSVPSPAGNRRPSNTSQYDNLSEGEPLADTEDELEEEDRYLQRLLKQAASLTHGPGDHPPPPLAEDCSSCPLPPPPPSFCVPNDPLSLPPPPPGFRTPSPPGLPQELEYQGKDSWVTPDSVFPLPPPSFADRLSPTQTPTPPPSASTSPRPCIHSASREALRLGALAQRGPISPGLRVPPGPPPATLKPTAQPPGVRAALTPETDFYRLHAPTHQLPKSITF